MLINVKMPTIVGILKFISMVNTTLEGLKVRKKATIRNRNNQIPHLTGKLRKHKKHDTHKRSALSQQVTTMPQGTDKTA